MDYTYSASDEKAWKLVIKIFGEQTTPIIDEKLVNRLEPKDEATVARRQRLLKDMDHKFMVEDGYNFIDIALSRLFINGVRYFKAENTADAIVNIRAALKAKGCSDKEIEQIQEFAQRFPNDAMQAAGDPVNTNPISGMLSNWGCYVQINSGMAKGVLDHVNPKVK